MEGAVALTEQICPKTFLVLSGYSQGAQVCPTMPSLLLISIAESSRVAHIAATNLTTDPPYASEDITSFTSTAALSGDSDRDQPFGAAPKLKVIEICHDGDGYGQPDGSQPPYSEHLTYCEDVAAKAGLIVQMSRLKKIENDSGWCEQG